MADRQYVYKITEIVKVTDGDTYWLRCDVGFRQNILINVRLSGYDCPEAHRGSDYEKAEAISARRVAYRFLAELDGGIRWIRTEPDPDSFGRWLGEIWKHYGPDEPGLYLGDFLRAGGLASIWPTRWRDEFDKGAV